MGAKHCVGIPENENPSLDLVTSYSVADGAYILDKSGSGNHSFLIKFGDERQKLFNMDELEKTLELDEVGRILENGSMQEKVLQTA